MTSCLMSSRKAEEFVDCTPTEEATVEPGRRLYGAEGGAMCENCVIGGAVGGGGGEGAGAAAGLLR